MHDIGEAVKSSISSPGQRVSIGPNPTFGSTSIPRLFPSVIPQVEAQSLTFSSVDVTASGSAAVVAAGGIKPVAATINVTARSIPKISAKASLNMEAYWESEAVVSTVVATLFASIATAEDAKANADLAAATGAATPVANWISAISAGQASVNAAGGSPNLVLLPSSAWPALAAEIASSTGLSTPSSDAVLSILGSRVLLSPEGTNAFVLDPSATVRAVRDSGFLVDPLSDSDTNVINVVADQVAAVFVQVPQWVAPIAVTAGP